MTISVDGSSRGTASKASASEHLRTNLAAARVSFTWFGVRKSLTTEQKAQAAEAFNAEGQFLSAAKKLLNTRDEKFAAVSRVRHRIVGYWKNLSLPYPEPGLRLIKQSDIESFARQMQEFHAELTVAVEELDRHFAALKAAAKQQLGELYNAADYPATLRGLFDVQWDFPSTQPPEYLLRLNPQLYQQECDRTQARFQEAVSMAEQAFIAELSKLVEHLTERLNAGPEGERKVFRDSAVTSLTEFFDRFRSLNIHSNADLDRLVETAQNAIRGVEPQAVRDNDALRRQIAMQLSAVAATLDHMLVEQPRRRILRPARQGAPS